MVIDKFRSTILKYGLINKGERILVGVSGGPDSVSLLYLLKAIKKELDLDIRVAHLDHMLRADSGKDLEFVRSLCLNLAIPITVARIDVRKYAKRGSIEEVARNYRFNFLIRNARKFKADKIALGHNLDDQAETILMRMLRGTGLFGLSGILPKRKIKGITVIRPLIEVTRKEIEGFLKRKKVTARLDPTNKEDIYLRNRIRNKLLPLLEKEYNSNIKELLANTAESIACDYDYLNLSAQRLAKIYKRRFNLRKLSNIHPSLSRMLFRNAIALLKGDTRRITFRHIREIEDLILNRPINSVVNLPKGVCVRKKKNFLEFTLSKQQ